MACTLEEIKKRLKENLSEKRYVHSLGTMETAGFLAQKFGLDIEKARLAGLLHDCAKCMSSEKLLEIIKERLPNIKDEELLNYKTYHAPVGAYLALEKFGVSDGEVISAIACHTMGKVNMSDFEKIIFLADKIEPETRDEEFRTKVMEIINEKGLDCALLLCFQETIKSLAERKLKICARTIDVYNELLDKM